MKKMKLFAKGRKPLIMAHRGSNNFPENSLQAFTEAVSMNVDVIETDVRLTRDEEIVIFHDESVDRITNEKGKICDLNLEELKLLDMGYYFKDKNGNFPFRSKNYYILTLDELFTTFPDIQINLDIKSSNKIAVELVGSKIKQYDRENNVIVGSFHQKIIESFRDKFTVINTVAGPKDVKNFILRNTLYLNWTIRNLKYNCFQLPIYYGEKRIIDRKFIDWAHKKDLSVHVWTINNEKEMKELIELNVDGIFTDNPLLLGKVIKEFLKE